MTVRAGREILALPGPTNMPDEVLQAMHRPALDIYSREMIDLSDSLHRDLSNLFATKNKSYIYISNGHGAWEGALSNVLSRGDKVLVLESGRFAVGWGSAARLMGAEVEVLKGDWRRAVRADEVEARLRQDKNHEIKAILVAQVDTASGVFSPLGSSVAVGELPCWIRPASFWSAVTCVWSADACAAYAAARPFRMSLSFFFSVLAFVNASTAFA